MAFADPFSKQAADYARYRPRYPRELFAYLSGLTPAHEAAWDCATGNGQAAQGLSEFYQRVVATDASAEQIRNAGEHPKITFSVAHAERSGLAASQFDVVTVAAAAHWLDLSPFYREAKRVLKPGGVIALWTYGRVAPATDPAVLKVVSRFGTEILGPYWAKDITKVAAGDYKVEFPFERIAAPAFRMAAEWDLEQTLGFLFTWSATQTYIDRNRSDPRDRIVGDLLAAFGSRDRRIRWEWEIDFWAGRS
jgi:SAM-dependent methyltransferase